MKTLTTWDELFEFMTWCIQNEYMVEPDDSMGSQLTEKALLSPMDDVINLFLSEKELKLKSSANNSPTEESTPKLVTP